MLDLYNVHESLAIDFRSVQCTWKFCNRFYICTVYMRVKQYMIDLYSVHESLAKDVRSVQCTWEFSNKC